MTQTQRRVVCAANWHDDAGIVLGARHFDFLMHRAIQIENDARFEHCQELIDPIEWEQGFIDQRGEFMTREEAWTVAEAAGQILRRCGGDGTKLYSENLY